jgi:hypothetical protein
VLGPRQGYGPDAASATRLRAALRRTRARMVDLDSWVSGGLGCPFATAPPRLRERGLALYRVPAGGAAKLRVGARDVRVRCLAADHGEVISAGFWLPTGIRGDFALDLRYELREWSPGPREACLALSATRADGASCHYAQQVTARARDSFVMAVLDQRPSPPAGRLSSRSGWLRLARSGASVRAAHAETRWFSRRRWVDLAVHREEEVLDLLVGAKLWTHGPTGSLEVAFTDLRIEATIPDDHAPVLPPRPDPRQERS